MRIKTHQELVEELEKAQYKIRMLKQKLANTTNVEALTEENRKLREFADGIIQQRDDLWECLKLRHEEDGLL